jgi:hypothetical protein
VCVCVSGGVSAAVCCCRCCCRCPADTPNGAEAPKHFADCVLAAKDRARLLRTTAGYRLLLAPPHDGNGCGIRHSNWTMVAPLLSPVVPAVPRGDSAVTRRVAMGFKTHDTVTHMPTGPSRPQRHAHWAPACGFPSLRTRQPGGAMSAIRRRACLLFYRCVGCYQQNRLHHRSSEMNVVHVVSRAACLLLPMCAGRAHVTRARVGVRNLTAAAGGVVATRHEPVQLCYVATNKGSRQPQHTTRLLRPSTQRRAPPTRADTHTMAKVRTQHSAAPAVDAPLNSTGPGGLPSSCVVRPTTAAGRRPAHARAVC